jgi:uncharacterized caspase-like protein
MAKIALLIGISEYERLTPLPSAAKDVDALKHVLQNPEIGGFAPSEITTLLNPQKHEIEAAIYSLFANRRKDDLVLFYFSGHGITSERGEFYLSTRSTRKNDQG